MERIKVQITGLGHEGEGVGRAEGKATFVAGALPGETILAEIRQQKKNFQRGLLLEVLERSAERIDAPCSVFEDCGGCQLQHLDYHAGLNWKRQKVEDALIRLGKITEAKVNPVIGMAEPWRYRNKVTLQAGEVKGKLALGYFSQKTNRLVPFTDCLLLPDQFNQLKDKLVEFLTRHKVTARMLQQVVIRYSPATSEVMLGLLGLLPELPWQEITETFPDLKSLVVVDPANGKSRVVRGNKVIHDRLFGNQFAVSFPSFVQVNPEQTIVLYERALAYAELQGTETVVDAYCGIGTITLALARSAGRVIGVEVSEQAIRDARENARANGIDNVEFYAALAERILPQLAKEGLKVDVVVVDPPRKGCDREALKAIVELGPKRIVYVSCDPATLARDLGLLQELGYATKEVQPVDMFPWTAHVECVCRLHKMHS